MEEIRGAFTSYGEIDGISTDRLPYLKAVIEEGLRAYPVVPFGLPRESPGETVDGVFVPKGVCLHTKISNITQMLTKLFKDRGFHIILRCDTFRG